MLEVTTVIDNHACGQAFGEVRHRLVDVFLWQLVSKVVLSDSSIFIKFYYVTPVH